MTTTAHEDQFTTGTQTIEPVRQPYGTVAILRRNIADMEVALKQQTELKERAEAELAKLAQQSPIKYLYRVIDCFGHDVLRDDPKGATILETVPLFAAPVPAPAVPDDLLLCDVCGAECDDPWHYSKGSQRHIHACDNCHTSQTGEQS